MQHQGSAVDDLGHLKILFLKYKIVVLEFPTVKISRDVHLLHGRTDLVCCRYFNLVRTG